MEKAREINLDGDPSRIDPDVPVGISNGIPALRQEMGIPKEKTQTRFVLPLFQLKQFHRHVICWLKKNQLLDIKANNWEPVVSGESSKRKPWALEELKR